MSDQKKRSASDKLRDDWQDVMRTDQGRRLLNNLLDISGFHRPAFTGQSNQTIHNCGMQKVGEYIDSQARKSDPDNYIRMIKESLNGN